jgi:hypothetical protein
MRPSLIDRPPAALALAALALGALAVGALAIGFLAIRRLEVRSARFRRLEIDELVIRRLREPRPQYAIGSAKSGEKDPDERYEHMP